MYTLKVVPVKSLIHHIALITHIAKDLTIKHSSATFNTYRSITTLFTTTLNTVATHLTLCRTIYDQKETKQVLFIYQLPLRSHVTASINSHPFTWYYSVKTKSRLEQTFSTTILPATPTSYFELSKASYFIHEDCGC